MSEERDEFIRDIAITAVESGYDGIGYWASCRKYKWSSVTPASLDHMLKFPEIRITPAEDPEDFKDQNITAATIRKGLRLIVDGTVKVREDLFKAIALANRENDGGHIDADCADVIVQVGLFGEIVYG